MTLIQVSMHLTECILDITPSFPRVPLKLRMDISRQETHRNAFYCLRNLLSLPTQKVYLLFPK